MHNRRLACFILGGWLAGSLFMWMVATQNFKSVDRLLAAPAGPAAARIQDMGRDTARAFLRYQVSEQNRWYFETWEVIQLGLAAFLIAIAVVERSSGWWPVVLSTCMLLVVLIEHFYVTPEVVRLGRAIDFVALTAPSAERTRF